MEFEKWIELGKQSGLEVAELRTWITQQQEQAREERALAREEKEKERVAAKEAGECKIQLLQLRIQLNQSGNESRASNEHLEVQEENSLRRNTSRLLVSFDERRDDLDAFIRRFESIAKGQKWPESQWSTALSTCLSGEALSVYGRLPPSDAADYTKVKTALLKRFRFTADGFRDKFNNEKPVGSETATQYAARLSHYFDRWVELSKTNTEFTSLRALLIKERFLHGTLRQETAKRGTGHPPIPRCYLCNRGNHPPQLCRYKPAANAAIVCYTCGGKGHRSYNCREGSNRFQASCVYAPTEVAHQDHIRGGYLEPTNREQL
ncbi:hypothetical protein HPB49_014367 [Dermacentor silvarum]|uniref:Uncharacterized protein n=1 Tax=Dermacentor silvarum TaxID=543639 RepID=A0ACB8DDN3_DERSI|nr:hypothetical protein HPB49_014367 [Dermacentor silvarum]